MTLYSQILQYLPRFIEGAGTALTGTIAVGTIVAPGPATLTGTDTKFQNELTVGDQIRLWKPDSDNHSVVLTVATVPSQISATATISVGTTAESDLNGIVIDNDIAQSLLITIDNALVEPVDDMRSDYRFSQNTLNRICWEMRLFPGGWESVVQLQGFLAVIFDVHERRGTEGANMATLNDPAVGILGECDRITENAGGTSLTNANLGWTLAGDIAYEFTTSVLVPPKPTPDSTDATTLSYTYPDFTKPSAAHPLGEYSVGDEAICWLECVDMLLIQLTNTNVLMDEKQIRKIIKEIVPLDRPYLADFL